MSRFIFLLSILVYTVSSQSYAQFLGDTNWRHQVDSNIDKVLVGDFNGDRRSDITFHIYDTYADTDSRHNSWKIMLSNGTGFQTAYKWAYGSALNDGVWIGDFNGDGLDDRVTLVKNGGTYTGWWVALTNKLNNTSNQYISLGETQWYQYSAPNEANQIDSVLIGDYNGDGKSDISYHIHDDLAYPNTNHDKWIVLFANSTQNGFEAPNEFCHWSAVNDGVWSGDFNGDGLTDHVTLVKYPNSYCGWWVALTSSSTFSSLGETPWYQYASSDWSEAAHIDYAVTGDFNGDSKADIAYHITNSSDVWKVLLSNSSGNGFQTPTQFCSGSAVNNGTWSGDFNGDGITDKMTHVNSTDATWGGWWVSLSQNNVPRQVGVWYYPTYYYDTTGGTISSSGWLDRNTNGTLKRDSCKIPIVGWGADTMSCLYSCQTDSILKRQFSAIQKCGFDFIITDNTNGIPGMSPSVGSHNYSDGCAYNALSNIYSVLAGEDLDHTPYTLKAAISLGMEYWGPHSNPFEQDCSWDNWDNQRLRQNYALSLLNGFFNSNVYYKYLGKPLFVPYIDAGLDVNWIDGNLRKQSYWHYKNFTVRHSVSWGYTFARNRDVSGFGTIHVDGIDTKRYWGYGSGATDSIEGKTWSLRSLPTDCEHMAIMTGFYPWNAPDKIPIMMRIGNDEYYIKSWLQVIKAMPKMVTVCSWNEWNEENVIEGCIGDNGWKDLKGNPTYDYYLQITRAYIKIFKEELLEVGTFFKEEGSSSIYEVVDPLCCENTGTTTPPNLHPVIVLPVGWAENHSYDFYAHGEYKILTAANSKVDDANIIKEISVSAYPNPFNPSINIAFTLPRNGFVKLEILNILGQTVKVLVNEQFDKGKHHATWNANGIASGTYFTKLEINGEVKIKKILYLK